MPKKKLADRIASLKAFIATQEDKLAKIKTVQTITAKMDAARKEVENLEVVEAKQRQEAQVEAAKVAADQKRKDDQRAKILMGAGLQMLDQADAVHIRAKIWKVLGTRDQKWLGEYTAKYNIAWSASDSTETDACGDDVQPPHVEPIDPATGAVMRALRNFQSTTLSLVESEFLGGSEGVDREALEVLCRDTRKTPLHRTSLE